MYQMISEKASKLELIERFGHLNLKEIVHQEYPTIGSLERIHGKDKAEKAMAVIVADLSSSFSGDLAKDEIMEIVTEVRSGLNRNITLEGLYLICSSLKRSSLFKLKVNHVLKAVEDHLNEQSKAHQTNNYNKHLELKQREPRKNDKNPFADEGYRKAKIAHLNKNFTKNMKE